MGIRPDITKETYDEVMQLARKNSIISVVDFESALTVILSLIRKRSKAA